MCVNVLLKEDHHKMPLNKARNGSDLCYATTFLFANLSVLNVLSLMSEQQAFQPREYEKPYFVVFIFANRQVNP